MAFQAARDDGAIEVRAAVAETGAVHPGVKLRPIRDGKLKELIAFPIQVGLTFFSGASDEIDALRMSFSSGGCQKTAV